MPTGVYERKPWTEERKKNHLEATTSPEFRKLVSKGTKEALNNSEERQRKSDAGMGKKNPFYKHGLSKHPLNGRWNMMKQRCNNPNNVKYKDYGGRGITVCDEWMNDFKKYYDWCMDNGYKQELHIDRRDNDGNYEPGNCRFVTPKVNANNKQRRDKVKIK